MIAEKFETQLERIRKEEFTTRYYYNKGKCIGEIGLKNLENLENLKHTQEFSDAVFQDVFDEVAYQNALTQLQERRMHIFTAFKNNIFVKYGIENNPKRELLFAIAYENGHSGGLSEIENWVRLLVDLIR